MDACGLSKTIVGQLVGRPKRFDKQDSTLASRFQNRCDEMKFFFMPADVDGSTTVRTEFSIGGVLWIFPVGTTTTINCF